MGLHRWYRGTGADAPYDDPLPAHPGVAMEGYFWRLTDVERGRVVIALCGVNQGPQGPWATLGLAGHPSPAVAMVTHPEAWADPDHVGAYAGTAFAGHDRRLRVDIGPQARLDVVLSELRRWPRRRFGGSSVFHAVPGLNQYWHPWILGGRADGIVVLGDDEWQIRGAQLYAEKNWGGEGFPDAWWWGQAQAFDEPDACVAFAGGRVSRGRLAAEMTALVVALPGVPGEVVRLGNPVTSPVRADVGDDYWRFTGRNHSWQIEVEGEAPLGAAHVLPVPQPSAGRNTAGAMEHLAGTMRVRVRRDGRLAWTGTSHFAGLEHGGIDRARAELRRRGLPDEADHAAPATPASRSGHDPDSNRHTT